MNDELLGFEQRHDLSVLLLHSPIEVGIGAGVVVDLGASTRDYGVRRVLLVTDSGLVAAGHVERGVRCLRQAGVEVIVFDGVIENPTTVEVAAGLELARSAGIDGLVALGGGSSIDTAKGINLLLTNGGEIKDYWGIDKAKPRMLPLVAVPTTAGTGSEAQSFALITDPQTRRKMACGVRAHPQRGGLRPRCALLDPDLTATQPLPVARATGIDAIAHAVESAGCNARTEISRSFSRQAWRCLSAAFTDAVSGSADVPVREEMLVGAHLAGCAIEQSMLGAAHACANPLSARFGITHGVAVGLLLPHVVQFNCAGGANPYADLDPDRGAMLARLAGFLGAAGLPTRLTQLGVPAEALPELAAMAAQEWTAQFNPRVVDETALLGIYERAW